jgi:hypothetical protein
MKEGAINIIDGYRENNEFSSTIKLNRIIDECVEELRSEDLSGLGKTMLDFIVKKKEFRDRHLEEIKKNGSNSAALEKCKQDIKEEIRKMGKEALKSQNIDIDTF